MYLFIDPVGPNITLIWLEWGKLIFSKEISQWKDFDTFPDELVEVVDLYNIEEIWCICGPAAFTRIRIVTLAINTLHIVRHIPIKWCHFFDIIDSKNPILKANTTEYIIDAWHGETKIVEVGDLPNGTYRGYGDKNDFTGGKVFVEYTRDLSHIARIFAETDSLSLLSPIYLKAPHITWSKKSTSHFWEKMKK